MTSAGMVANVVANERDQELMPKAIHKLFRSYSKAIQNGGLESS